MGQGPYLSCEKQKQGPPRPPSFVLRRLFLASRTLELGSSHWAPFGAYSRHIPARLHFVSFAWCFSLVWFVAALEMRPRALKMPVSILYWAAPQPTDSPPIYALFFISLSLYKSLFYPSILTFFLSTPHPDRPISSAHSPCPFPEEGLHVNSQGQMYSS